MTDQAAVVEVAVDEVVAAELRSGDCANADRD